MKCPKCDSNIEKDYKYCYECGVDIKKYNDTKRLNKDIRSTVILAFISTILILGYPSIQYIGPTIHNISIKEYLSSNTKEHLECSKSLEDENISISFDFVNKKLKGYEANYKFNTEEALEDVKLAIADFRFETGFNLVLDGKALTYTVDPISVINDQIYEYNNVSEDYDETLNSLTSNGYKCK